MSVGATTGLRSPTATPDCRVLPRLLAAPGGPGWDAHVRQWGWKPAGSPRLIDEVEQAGLRGRGGAAFPTARKLRAVAGARAGRFGRSAAGSHRIVVANGIECEPASQKDGVLLLRSPHLVLDGISIAADVVGADEAILCVARSAGAVIRSVAAALVERQAAGADSAAIRLEPVPNRFVAGEESALVHWLNGGEAKPTFVPPRPFERGVRGRPTLVNNVETLAHLALIARFGAGWYASLGTPSEPGTALVTVSGDVGRPGVYEVALGVPVAEVLRVTGGHPDGATLLVGGYSGAWIQAGTAATLTLDAASLARVGTGLGCGAIAVVDPRSGSCGLLETARVTRWLASQSARQCGPCTNGLPAVASAMEALAAGNPDRRWESQLDRWLQMVDGRGACHHPDGVVRFVRSALANFADEIERHRQHGPCSIGRMPLPTPSFDERWR
jgi:NADH:ubiquinone oxidoreductase subunit F (NADH-binding)